MILLADELLKVLMLWVKRHNLVEVIASANHEDGLADKDGVCHWVFFGRIKEHFYISKVSKSSKNHVIH